MGFLLKDLASQSHHLERPTGSLIKVNKTYGKITWQELQSVLLIISGSLARIGPKYLFFEVGRCSHSDKEYLLR